MAKWRWSSLTPQCQAPHTRGPQPLRQRRPVRGRHAHVSRVEGVVQQDRQACRALVPTPRVRVTPRALRYLAAARVLQRGHPRALSAPRVRRADTRRRLARGAAHIFPRARPRATYRDREHDDGCAARAAAQRRAVRRKLPVPAVALGARERHAEVDA